MQRKEEETNQCKPKEVKQEKVAPTMFGVDVPIPAVMKLDRFRPDGTPCYVLDLITPGPTIPSKGPTIPSKIHPARAKKKSQRN